MDAKNSKQHLEGNAPHRPNEGKGNKTAAGEYNKAQRRFVRSGKVKERPDAAEEALDSAERSEIEHAELVGKSHAAGEDPALKKP